MGENLRGRGRRERRWRDGRVVGLGAHRHLHAGLTATVRAARTANQEFIAGNGGADAFRILPDSGAGVSYIELEDKVLEERWQDHHQEHAVLRPVPKRVNLRFQYGTGSALPRSGSRGGETAVEWGPAAEASSAAYEPWPFHPRTYLGLVRGPEAGAGRCAASPSGIPSRFTHGQDGLPDSEAAATEHKLPDGHIM
ncbi:hypothetical protein [Streptomyces mirabilis]|uniref:hypothetical protein n=1 Tax=Streptomyces mirabilis TaxID=68239 RepID=UPI0036C6859D